jgi:uncharacterized membrane protein YhaH (DUF805 family)
LARAPGCGGSKRGLVLEMNFSEAVQSCFSKYAGFSGRASRSEYWYWVLFQIVASFVVGFSVTMIGGPHMGGAVNLVLSLALFVPSLAVAVRRLHDVNKSGWWYLLAFTIVGVLVLLFWFVSRGTDGENKYGQSNSDPLKAIGAQA